MASASYEEHFFDSIDGVRLFSRRWMLQEPKGEVALVHGFAEHSGRYQTLAQDLCAAGWSVSTFDYRGHGQSGGRRAHIDSFQDYLDDLNAFLDELQRIGQKAEPAILGHSQGGLIAARHAQAYPGRITRLILSSPFFGLALPVPAIKVWAGKALSGILPTLSMKNGINAAFVSHDPAVVEQYANDPLVSDIATARWFTEILAAQEQVQVEAAKIRCPLLVLQAGDDHLCSVPAVKRFFAAVPFTDKILKVYDGYYHEVLNEVGRDRVIADLVAWLGNHNP